MSLDLRIALSLSARNTALDFSPETLWYRRVESTLLKRESVTDAREAGVPEYYVLTHRRLRADPAMRCLVEFAEFVIRCLGRSGSTRRLELDT